MQFFASAYYLGRFLRRWALPRSISLWSLRILQTKLVNIGAKVVRHDRFSCSQMSGGIDHTEFFRGNPETDLAFVPANNGVKIKPYRVDR